MHAVVIMQILNLANQCSLFMTIHDSWDQGGWPPTETRTIIHAHDHWWALEFANAFISPGVNSLAELVPSPRVYAWNGAPRRWLGEYAWKIIDWLTTLQFYYNFIGQCDFDWLWIGLYLVVFYHNDTY
jgi:hypothetical protein